MKRNYPYVAIYHDHKKSSGENHNDLTFDTSFLIHKSRSVFCKVSSYGSFFDSKEDSNRLSIMNDDDLVMQHSFNSDRHGSGWSPVPILSNGGIFNSNRTAQYSNKLPTGKKLLVMTHPDSDPTVKDHDGTIHWPKPTPTI